MLLVVVGRFVNFLVPLAFAEIVRIFEDKSSNASPWPYLFAYVILRFLQATGGLAALRDVGIFVLLSNLCRVLMNPLQNRLSGSQ